MDKIVRKVKKRETKVVETTVEVEFPFYAFQDLSEDEGEHKIFYRWDYNEKNSVIIITSISKIERHGERSFEIETEQINRLGDIRLTDYDVAHAEKRFKEAAEQMKDFVASVL